MSFRQGNATVAVVIAASLLACALAIAKPFPPREGCRPVSKIEYNAAKPEHLLKSRRVCTSSQDRFGDASVGTVQSDWDAANGVARIVGSRLRVVYGRV
jgi:hypothetical protein